VEYAIQHHIVDKYPIHKQVNLTLYINAFLRCQMEGARCAFQDHNVKVAHAHSLIYLMAKLILTFATLVLLLTIKVLRYMGLIFMEHV
jgi:hypothetical protein